MRALPGPTANEIEVTGILHALADPVRLEILSVLADGDEHSCGTQGYDFGIHKSTLSHHLAVMRHAGLTTTRVEGRHHWIRLRRDELDARFPGLLTAILATASTRRPDQSVP